MVEVFAGGVGLIVVYIIHGRLAVRRYELGLRMCRLHQLAAKKGLEVDWVQSFQDRETSNSSGDQGTETAISLSRCVHQCTFPSLRLLLEVSVQDCTTVQQPRVHITPQEL